MIYIGINVAKDKHDYFITNSNGKVLFNTLPYPTIAKVLKPYFREFNLYPLI